MNFTNGAELLEYCEKEHKKISEAMFERETTFSLSHSGFGFGNFFDHCGVLFAASALAAAGYFKLFDEKRCCRN